MSDRKIYVRRPEREDLLEVAEILQTKSECNEDNECCLRVCRWLRYLASSVEDRT